MSVSVQSRFIHAGSLFGQQDAAETDNQMV